MFLLFSLGVVFWLIYGIGVRSRPIIAANAVTLILAFAILALKIGYERNRPKAERGPRA
jgi:MtN3 and saliva related transmembrane protein